jgi:hypothetical protein
MPKNKEIRISSWKGPWVFGFLLFMAGSITMCSSDDRLKTTIIGAAMSIIGCIWIVIAELIQTREESRRPDSEARE